MVQNATDGLAVASIAKETLVFIGAEMAESQRRRLSYQKRDLIQVSHSGESGFPTEKADRFWILRCARTMASLVT